MGPEHPTPTEEIACTSDGGGLITSGGGFSNKYPTPAYQAAEQNSAQEQPAAAVQEEPAAAVQEEPAAASEEAAAVP